jgi:hypothetical protein
MRTLAHLASWSLGLALSLALVGCGPEEPSVRYSGNTLPPKAVEKIKVYRATQPDRPFEELGMVEVSCPTMTHVAPYSASQEGGCTLDQAMQMAIGRAAEVGADAVANVHSSAAANGNIVSLSVVALRFTGPPKAAPAPAAVAAPATPAAPKPTLEERLKRLQDMNEQGLITPQDYARRRAEILQEL